MDPRRDISGECLCYDRPNGVYSFFMMTGKGWGRERDGERGSDIDSVILREQTYLLLHIDGVEEFLDRLV